MSSEASFYISFSFLEILGVITFSLHLTVEWIRQAIRTSSRIVLSFHAPWASEVATDIGSVIFCRVAIPIDSGRLVTVSFSEGTCQRLRVEEGNDRKRAHWRRADLVGI